MALALIIVGWLLFGRGGDGKPKYMTQEVTSGELTVTVTATGNLEPRNQVDIGSELSGTIRTRHGRRQRRGQSGSGADDARHDAPGGAGAAGAELARVGRRRASLQSAAGRKEARANSRACRRYAS